jgi:hypothetical protein
MNLIKLGSGMLALFSVALMSSPSLGAVKPTDGAKFKNKTVQMKEKSDFSVLLSLHAGKEVTATTDGKQQTDVHLFVYDANNTELGKDVSPGPKCEVKFTPEKDGDYKLLVSNLGPGANKVTLAVKVAE